MVSRTSRLRRLISVKPLLELRGITCNSKLYSEHGIVWWASCAMRMRVPLLSIDNCRARTMGNGQFMLPHTLQLPRISCRRLFLLLTCEHELSSEPPKSFISLLQSELSGFHDNASEARPDVRWFIHSPECSAWLITQRSTFLSFLAAKSLGKTACRPPCSRKTCGNISSPCLSQP